ncbi:hypothetical protein NA57DRAFT_60074 [Rhizodiscina lignyota]|uniref:Uncharacterized protein n=1 Tax=Rhizodiscina lignyota TaxID=1504668 RepID=A0A9P4I9T2_9PEZI|nr:hypothetical protein NA57DRAFT_60074 [Rhizodiscina lignyota]
MESDLSLIKPVDILPLPPLVLSLLPTVLISSRDGLDDGLVIDIPPLWLLQKRAAAASTTTSDISTVVAGDIAAAISFDLCRRRCRRRRRCDGGNTLQPVPKRPHQPQIVQQQRPDLVWQIPVDHLLPAAEPHALVVPHHVHHHPVLHENASARAVRAVLIPYYNDLYAPS